MDLDEEARWTSNSNSTLTCVPFDMVVLSMILFNAALIVVDQAYVNESRRNNRMGVEDDSRAIHRILNVLEFVFMGLFTVEAILRLIALRCKRYVLDLWNSFDLIILIMGWAALLGT